MGKKIGSLFMVIGAAMLTAALSLIIFNRVEDINAGKAAKDALYSIEEALKETPKALLDITSTDKTDDEMPVASIDGYDYIGRLYIPVLRLELPVMSQWDNTRLSIAPCRYFGSVKTKDLVICGHNFSEHFGGLKELEEGDQVFFTGMDGITSVYKVEETEILAPEMISEMTESGYDLTLYTCTYGGQARVTVRCNIADE